MDLSFKGNIFYVISSESNNMFILTDEDFFYVIEKGKFNEIEYKLQSSELEKNKKKKEEEKNTKSKSQSYDLDSQIWCDKLGTHVIIKYIKTNFYYNLLWHKK